MDTLAVEARDILADWSDLTVEDMGPFWLIAGNDPQGVRRAGTRDDVVSLAHTLAEQGRYVEPEPEPVSADIPVTLAPDAAPSETPPATDGGSVSDEPLDESEQPEMHTSGIGVMLGESRMGVMASDRTEELRAQRIGEVVMAYTTLVDARYTADEARHLQVLRSRSNAAADGTGEPLDADEQADLDLLAIDEAWSARMGAEQQRRLSTLSAADADALRAFNARTGWPET